MNDHEVLLAATKQAINDMTPEERKAFVLSLCASVDKLAQTVVANADVLWETYHKNNP